MLAPIIDEARRRSGFKSDAQLSRALGMTDTMVFHMRRGTSWPSEEKLILLAQFAGRDPRLVLLEMHEARAKNARTRAIYGEMKRFFLSAASVLVLAIGGTSSDVNAMGTDRHAARDHCILSKILDR